jgi:hypothetical protein
LSVNQALRGLGASGGHVEPATLDKLSPLNE